MKLREQTIMSKIIKTKFKFIYLEITNKCNLKCYFCPSSTLKIHEEMQMSDLEKYVEEIFSLLDAQVEQEQVYILDINSLLRYEKIIKGTVEKYCKKLFIRLRLDK